MPAGQRPRVLIVITLAERGGAQTYVASLLPALSERFDVMVAAHGPGPLRDAALAARASYRPLDHVRRPLSPWHDLLGFLELVALMRRERPHIVHANSSKAGVLARLAAWIARVPIRVFTVHGWAFLAYNGLTSRAYLIADRAMRPLTSLVICVAENERRAGIAAETCRADRTIVVHNAVEVGTAPVATHDAAVPTIVTVGRLAWPKDVSTLIRALARLDAGSFRALLVGDGPDRPAVERELTELGLEHAVAVLGERGDVAAILAASDIFVLASVSEGLPMSILEAMAAGLPVVASQVGGVAEEVEDGVTGILVPAGDPELLAGALRRLLTDPRLRRELGAAGRLRAQTEFDLPRFRQAHVDAYARLLSARGLAPP